MPDYLQMARDWEDKFVNDHKEQYIKCAKGATNEDLVRYLVDAASTYGAADHDGFGQSDIHGQCKYWELKIYNEELDSRLKACGFYETDS